MSRICHISTVHLRNDTRILIKECSYLVKEGHDVSLIISDGKGDEIKNGIKIFDIGLSSKKWNTQRLNRFFFSSYKALKKALFLKCDFYHFHDPELIFIGIILKKIFKKKVIYDIHEDVSLQIHQKSYIPKFLKYFVRNIFSFFENYASGIFNNLVTATPEIKNKFKLLNPNTICVNNYPILNELKSDYIKSNKNKSICYIGGISIDRGVYNLVKAIEKTDVTLHLAGSFWYSSEEKKIKSLDGWKNVKYYGVVNRNDLKKILSRSMAGIVPFLPKPNHMNCQPNKLFEYMSSGLPVIASNFKNIVYLVEKNNIGFCFNPTEVSELRFAIFKIINNPIKSKLMGDKAYDLVINRYNWEKEFLKLNKIYI